MRDLMDIKLFCDLDSDIRLARRITRDISDRSRKIDTVIERYFRFVKPAFDIYILPTKKYADFVIPQDNLSSLPVEIVSYYIIMNDLHIKKEVTEKMRRKESIFQIQEDFNSRKYFYDPKISELSVVNSEEDIKKFNKIIHYICYKLKKAYYSVYCASIVDYLLNKHKINNKDKLRSIFIDMVDVNDIQKIKEKINKEEKCIISLFEPNLIKRNEELEKYLTNLFSELKDYNVQYELLTVYMTNKTFNELNEFVTKAGVKINYITVYFSDNLFLDEENIINSGKINSNMVDLGDTYYITRGNLISKFLFEKNKYLN
jgi:uridine kinase